MPVAKFDDIEIYYETQGRGEPLILIAGYGWDHTFWDGMVKSLAKKFKVIVFDNRGVGQTKDSGKPFTIDTMTDDVKRLTEVLELTQFHVCGQSMGGAIAETLAMKHPKEVKKLILLNTVTKFNLVTQYALNNLIELQKINVPINYIIDTVLPWMFCNDFLAVPGHIEMLKQNLLNNPHPQSLEDQSRQFTAIRLFDAKKWVQRIKAFTLVVGGENDLIAPLAENHALARAINNAVFKTISGGHSSPLEQPDNLVEIILSFLKL
jgi:3-oxoadipate enol-lactonase